MAELKNCPVCGTPARMMVHDGCYSIRPISPRWIPVEERLPEIDECCGYFYKSVRVLCTCVQKNGRKMVKEGYCQISDGKCVDWIIPGTIHSVTHWMPMPEPPIKEDKK